LGVANCDTGVVVRDRLGTARREVLVAGFAVYRRRTAFRRLPEGPGLRVRLFLDVHRPPGDASLPEELLRRFAQRFRTQEWPGAELPELYYDPRSLDPEAVKRSSLHARCVVIDRRVALVTSANFTEAAQTRNIEVGALVRCERFAARLVGHFEALASAITSPSDDGQLRSARGAVGAAKRVLGPARGLGGPMGLPRTRRRRERGLDDCQNGTARSKFLPIFPILSCLQT
jgi:phosphatidylserine/phosphatidylglycerophosphate/cardiolipin synthase-like enzyme